MKWIGNYVEDDGVEILSEVLKVNNTLTRLNLECEQYKTKSQQRWCLTLPNGEKNNRWK